NEESWRRRLDGADRNRRNTHVKRSPEARGRVEESHGRVRFERRKNLSARGEPKVARACTPATQVKSRNWNRGVNLEGSAERRARWIEEVLPNVSFLRRVAVACVV
ncbi:hypothetical protein PPTG_24896, partial [Phytophthora nicotianae INRA-310]